MATSKKQLKTMDDYIAAFPKNVKDILEKIRQAIRESAPKAEEAISYGIPAFRLNDRDLVYFAAWKNHIGFYPTPSGAPGLFVFYVLVNVKNGSSSTVLERIRSEYEKYLFSEPIIQPNIIFLNLFSENV